MRPYAKLFAPPRALPSLTQAAAQAPTPPEPRHTGIAALVRTTGSDFVAFPKRRSTWSILGIGAAAALVVHPFDDRDQRLRGGGGRTADVLQAR